jgi:X-X-X-Leu-X-X-Gly heptad repeat protein
VTGAARRSERESRAARLSGGTGEASGKAGRLGDGSV